MKNRYTRQYALKMLGLEPGADEKGVREAYRRLAKKYHPDCALNGGESCEKFLEVQKAYEALCHPKQGESGAEVRVKRQYAAPQQHRRRRTASRTEEMWSFFPTSFFDSLFGPSVDVEIELSPGEAHEGTTLSLDIPVESICSRCRGFGFAGVRACPACSGSGRIILSRQFTIELPPGLSDGDLLKIRVGETGALSHILHALVSVR